MQRFIARQNIDHYRRLLEAEQDPVARRGIERLLAEAMADLEAAERKAPGPIYPPSGPPRPRGRPSP